MLSEEFSVVCSQMDLVDQAWTECTAYTGLSSFSVLLRELISSSGLDFKSFNLNSQVF